MPSMSRVLRHGVKRKKQPVIIVIGEEKYTLQVPCTNCHGGESLVYSPATNNHIGKCQECTDGLVDTPLYAAVKKHMGIFPELPGAWRGKPIYGFRHPIRMAPVVGTTGTLHFYPDGQGTHYDQQRLGLCCQGQRRDNVFLGDHLAEGARVCQNCLRIKTLLEQRAPVVYG